jgi:hypothetical protein
MLQVLRNMIMSRLSAGTLFTLCSSINIWLQVSKISFALHADDMKLCTLKRHISFSDDNFTLATLYFF